MNLPPAHQMHARLWQAIDQIGSRRASKFEWKLASSLDWADLDPYLTACPGQAASIPDPDDPLETMVVWENHDGTILLESPHVPAHRDSIPVSAQEIRLYRADVNILARALAKKFNFTAQPASASGPVYRIGIVQRKGNANVSVMLHIPDTPVTSIVEIHKVMQRPDQTLLLLSSARWLRGIPLRDTVQVRTVFEFLNENEEEHLTTVIARSGRQPPRRKTPPAIEVRPEDSWEDVKIVINPSTGRLKISIGQRRLDVVIWNPKKQTSRKSGATRAAEILGKIAVATPQVWKNPSASTAEHATMRKGFQLLKKSLAGWVPVADGDPFEYDHTTHTHRPRFRLEMKQASRF